MISLVGGCIGRKPIDAQFVGRHAGHHRGFLYHREAATLSKRNSALMGTDAFAQHASLL
jgi:hypothetical protein